MAPVLRAFPHLGTEGDRETDSYLYRLRFLSSLCHRPGRRSPSLALGSHTDKSTTSSLRGCLRAALIRRRARHSAPTVAALPLRLLALRSYSSNGPPTPHIGGYDHQKIVEVVSDARDQIAERPHSPELTAPRFGKILAVSTRLSSGRMRFVRPSIPPSCRYKPTSSAGVLAVRSR